MPKLLLPLCLANTVLLVILLIYMVYNQQQPKAVKRVYPTQEDHGSTSCNAASCGATDPVSDPDYNMREIAKQSILLEEHLAVDAKFCRDCVTKHFLHIIGLANEAVMLAGANVSAFPLLAQTAPTYQSLFDQWLASRDTEQAHSERLTIAGSMRDFRKLIVVAYFSKD